MAERIENAYRQWKRDNVCDRDCLERSQMRQKGWHGRPDDIPKSDRAYSKLPFDKFDTSVLTVRLVERSRSEW